MPGAQLCARGGYCRTTTLAQPPPGTFPLAVSGRYLQTASGDPFLVNIAAASWSMVQAISQADFQSFADLQKSRGFNALHISAISDDESRFPSDSGNHFAAPNWKNTGGTSVPPFTTPGDFSTLNPAYVANLQAKIDYLASIGMLAFVVIDYIGYGGGDPEGWGSKMVADSDAHLTSYGQALATALSGRSNVIMTAGGDYKPAPGSTIESRVIASVNGFLANDSTRLWGAHWGGDTFGDASDANLGGDLSYDQAAFATAIGSSKLLYTHYAYNQGGKRARRRIRDAYQRSPTRPTLALDASYDGDNFTSSRLELRERTHATMCEGSCSMTYARGGDAASGGWVFLASLNATSSTQDHQYAWDFWSARPWASMAPDSAGTFVTAGRGTDGDTVDSYVSVLASTACLVAHFPSGSNRTITIDMSQFTGAGAFSGSGTRRIRKFDPTAGTYATLAASVATSGTVTVGVSGTYTLGTNGASDTDWLVVVD